MQNEVAIPYWPKEAPEGVLVKVLKYDDQFLTIINHDKRLITEFNFEPSLYCMVVTELKEDSCKAVFNGNNFTFSKKDSLCEKEGYKLQIIKFENQEVEML